MKTLVSGAILAMVTGAVGSGCGGQTLAISEVTNQWWHLTDADFNIYLEQSDPRLEIGELWYDVIAGPTPDLHDNLLAGDWLGVGNDRFQVEYEGDDYVVKAVRDRDQPDCYHLTISVVRDLACPYTVEPDEPVDTAT
ncbi:MAG: hypothetical protein ABMB14_40080 [Myxococcota bacterium]